VSWHGLAKKAAAARPRQRKGRAQLKRAARFSNPGGAKSASGIPHKMPRTEPHPRQSDGKALNEQARTRGLTGPT